MTAGDQVSKNAVEGNLLSEIDQLKRDINFLRSQVMNLGSLDSLTQSIGLVGNAEIGANAIHTTADVIDVNFWASIGVPNNVVTLVATVYVSGNTLYVGGQFTKIGGIAANHIAQYDLLSGVWSNLGPPTALNGAVYAIAVIGTTVYVGGAFTNANGIAAADYIASYTTAGGWAALGGGLNNVVYALAVIGTTLYAGGDFINVNGIAAADCIAKWSAGAWSAVGAGLNSTVYAFTVYGTDLYIGGLFTDAGGVAAADGVAKWDGSNYTALGTGSYNGVLALCVSNDDLYIGGGFTGFGGVTGADYIVVFNIPSATYRLLGDASAFALEVNTIAVIGTDVFIGGLFTSVGDVADTAYIVKFDGERYSSIGTLDNTVYGMAVYGSDLYVVGTFTAVNGRSSKGITAFIRTLESVLQYLEVAEQALQDSLLTPTLVRALATNTEAGSIAVSPSAATTVFDVAVPANFLAGESFIRFKITLQIVTNVNARTLTSVLSYGTTTLITTAPNHTGSKSYEDVIEGEIWASGSNAQNSRIATIRADTTTPTYTIIVGTGTGAENTSTAKNLKLTMLLAGSVTSSQIYNAVVELVPAP